MERMNQLVDLINKNDNIREFVKELKDLSKEECLVLDKEWLFDLLKHSDTKVRKNIAIIFRNCQIEGHESCFIDMFLKEENWIVKNEMMETIMKFDLTTHIQLLEDFYNQLTKDTNEDNRRHKEEMKGHLVELFYQYHIFKRPKFIDFNQSIKIILKTLEPNQELVFDKLDLKTKKIVTSGVLIQTDTIESFESIRDYQEMLIVLGGFKEVKLDIDVLAKKVIDSNIITMLEKMHQDQSCFTFRIDTTKLPGDKIKRLGLEIQKLSKGKLINSTSQYDIELRLNISSSETCQMFLKLHTRKDTRFLYRKHALATSLQPFVAASIVDLVLPFTTEDAKVIDLCCGSGTLLIERSKASPCKFMMGLDIFGDAIKMARENTDLAGEDIQYVQRDLNRFTHHHQFDEVISNLPVQSANKDRQSIETLYMQFMKKAIEFTFEEGYIFAYTSETEIFKKVLRFHKKEVELMSEKKIKIKKAESTLFILQVK